MQYTYTSPLKLSYREAAPIVGLCFPGYKGRRFEVVNVPSVELQNTYWSGGCRTMYVGFNLRTREVGALRLNTNPSQFGGNAEGTEVPLNAELIVVSLVTSGTYKAIRIFVHPDAMPKFLTQPGS